MSELLAKKDKLFFIKHIHETCKAAGIEDKTQEIVNGINEVCL
jgi:hypothetical protein